MPVAHADIDGKRRAECGKPVAQSFGLPARQLCKRGHTCEQLVMVGDLLDTLRADAASPQHVGEKRTDVIAALRSTERHDEHRVEHPVYFMAPPRTPRTASGQDKRR